MPTTSASTPLFSFGVVADPQYAALPTTMGRYYTNSLAKLGEAVDDFNSCELKFVVNLGDAIDRNWESYDGILAVFGRSKAPVHHVLGNHDWWVAPDQQAGVLGRLGLTRGYYDFGVPGWRFVVIDGTDVSLFANPEGSDNHRLAGEVLAQLQAAGAENANPWNGTLGEAQYAWLAMTLDAAGAAGERVIVFGHFPLLPAREHNLWHSQRLIDLLSGHRSVVAYFNGHDHRGSYVEQQGMHFLNFKGMVETELDNAYARVDVCGDRLEVVGFGLEPARMLVHRSPIDA